MMLILLWLIKNETENICFYHELCIETKYSNLALLINFITLNLSNYCEWNIYIINFYINDWFAFVLNGQAAMNVYSTASEYKCWNVVHIKCKGFEA